MPIFLASKTQEIFECRCDEDVTEDNPLKLLTKEKLQEDLFNRAAVCDFHPFKQMIQVCQLIPNKLSLALYPFCSWNMLQLLILYIMFPLYLLGLPF